MLARQMFHIARHGAAVASTTARAAAAVVPPVSGRWASTLIGDEGGIALTIHDDGFADVTMNRAKQFNTFNDDLIKRFTAIWDDLASRDGVRGVFVKSTGKLFSAGADLAWMKKTASYTREQNIEDAIRLGHMLSRMSRLPVPTIALVQGSCFGGGVGLVSTADISVGVSACKFTLSEVKLGLIPATISPYVVRRIGAAHARRYFLTAEAIEATKAHEIGLLHEVVEDQAGLDEWEAKFKKAILNNSPAAVAASKDLIDAVAGQPITPELIEDTAVRLCDARASEEGIEGLAAFFGKRKASWVP